MNAVPDDMLIKRLDCTVKTKLLRDYLLDNGIWIPKNRRLIADNLIASAKL
jgi:hypothetical protein